MKSNIVIRTMLAHRSIRKYTKKIPSDELVRTIVKASQQAPFAYQLYSILLSRNIKKNPFHAPLLFTICVDLHKFELIMKKRGWKRVTNDLSVLLFGIEDASYMAQNMVIAGRSLGLGSCFIGRVITSNVDIVKKYTLPKGVYPIVQLAMGYPAENPRVRPRYPLDFILFEDEYPKMSDKLVEKAMTVMDEGYISQDYYKKGNLMIPLMNRKKETYNSKNYGWTEHISRKLGLWLDSLDDQVKVLESRGFNIRP